MRREELTGREAESWAEFAAAIDLIDPNRREEPALANGWSMRDLLWHVAYWWDDLCDTLDRMAAGTYAESEETTDQINAVVLEVSRSMSLADVEAGAARARERMLAAWSALPEVDDGAAESFVSETIEHYDEHLSDLRAFAGTR